MGILLSRFRVRSNKFKLTLLNYSLNLSVFQSKLSTKDILEDIDKKLRSIDEFQQDTIERQKRIARRTIVTAVCVYIIAIAAFFVITSIQKFKLYYFTGLAVFAVV